MNDEKSPDTTGSDQAAPEQAPDDKRQPVGIGSTSQAELPDALSFNEEVAPVPAEETIELFAFMEAADESKAKGGAPVTIKSMIERAEKINAERNKK